MPNKEYIIKIQPKIRLSNKPICKSAFGNDFMFVPNIKENAYNVYCKKSNGDYEKLSILSKEATIDSTILTAMRNRTFKF